MGTTFASLCAIARQRQAERAGLAAIISHLARVHPNYSMKAKHHCVVAHGWDKPVRQTLNGRAQLQRHYPINGGCRSCYFDRPYNIAIPLRLPLSYAPPQNRPGYSTTEPVNILRRYPRLQCRCSDKASVLPTPTQKAVGGSPFPSRIRQKRNTMARLSRIVEQTPSHPLFPLDQPDGLPSYISPSPVSLLCAVGGTLHPLAQA